MSKITQKMKRLAPYTELDWTDDRSRQSLSMVHERLAAPRQRIKRWGAIAALLFCGVLLAATVRWWLPVGGASSPSSVGVQNSTAVVPAQKKVTAAKVNGKEQTHTQSTGGTALELSAGSGTGQKTVRAPLQFSDGSQASPLSTNTRMIVTKVSEQQVLLALRNGASRFDVTPNPHRRFEVDAGFIKVVVLGTSFTVHRSKDGVSVTVHRGVVRAEWSDGSTEIRPAQGEMMFVPHVAADTVRVAAQSEVATASQRSVAVVTPRKPENAILNTMAAVLQVADAQRLDGHPERAAQTLESGLSRFSTSPMAATASFTLGRVLLEECHRPVDAARAFQGARMMQPNGVLAEDALAREVEAWHLSGNQSEARRLALMYLKLYPEGARTKSVRRFGSIE